MNKEKLIKVLREEQSILNPKFTKLILTLSEEKFLDSYHVCENCKEKILDSGEIEALIRSSENAQDFQERVKNYLKAINHNCEK